MLHLRMKKTIQILSCFLILTSIKIYAQKNNLWTAFLDSTSTSMVKLIGYKDNKGNIKIKPKFIMTFALKFDKIIGVTEEYEYKKYKSYFLTKSGKIIGRDSLYIYDNGYDCENEGFIRFRDKKTGKVGLFNGNGNVVIPALYNDLSRTQNGMVIALQDATKAYLNKNQRKNEGDDFPSRYGKTLLLDTKNHILIQNLDHDGYLNLYSLKIESNDNHHPDRQSFKGEDTFYYSFIDYEREFNNWYKTIFTKLLTEKKLSDISYKEITYWDTKKGWITQPKKTIINANFKTIKKILIAFNTTENEDFISFSSYYPSSFNKPENSKYYNNCEEAKIWKYPIITVIINSKIKTKKVQDSFDFIRTDSGYKLISISLKSDQLN